MNLRNDDDYDLLTYFSALMVYKIFFKVNYDL